jgi:hypothetical protein
VNARKVVTWAVIIFAAYYIMANPPRRRSCPARHPHGAEAHGEFNRILPEPPRIRKVLAMKASDLVQAEPAATVQPELEPELAWQPSGGEPQPCHLELAPGCSDAGEEAYEVWFILPSQPLARVTMWLCPAVTPRPGGRAFTVSCRWLLQHGPWSAAGWSSTPCVFTDPSGAADAALEAAVALACGAWEEFPGGLPDCLHWDGEPW